MRNKLLVIGYCLLAMGSMSVAQDNIIDEVIWIVGEEAILRSEVEEERLRAQYEGVPIAGDPYCVIPEQLAIQKLFLHQAELDSIEANESSVSSQVDMRMNYYISQIGSKEKMEEYFRKTSTEIREEMMTSVRNQMIIQQMQSKITEKIQPTPAEVRRFYNQLSADSIPMVPAQVEVQILSIEPPVPVEETERIKSRLREFTDRVHNGTADFSMLARLYSEDTESAKRGGELGFVGKGQLVSEFADVAFNLTDPKKISKIVESEFGFHIIQLIDKRGDKVNVRHILRKPVVSQESIDKSLMRLDSIRSDIMAGKFSFEAGASMISDDKDTRNNNGLMSNATQNGRTSKFQLQDLPSEVARAVDTLKVGDISAPFQMINDRGKTVCVIAKLKNRTEGHKATITEDYQRLKSIVQSKLGEEKLQKWIVDKQKSTYVRINENWATCDFKYPGWIRK